MHDSCGVVGVWTEEEDVAQDIYVSLLQINHRGQESSGIVVSQEGEFFSHLGMGTVDKVFGEEIPEEDLVKCILDLQKKGASQESIISYLKENRSIMKKSVFNKLKGRAAIGHVRYSTTGASMVLNIQPMIGWFKGRQFAVAHNGNLIFTKDLREECEKKGFQFRTTTDTEVIVALITTSERNDFIEALREVLLRLKGSFSLVILYEDMVIGVRDAMGNRPLCWGFRNNTLMVCSESCALDVLGIQLINEVRPGEMVVFQDESVKISFWTTSASLCGLCIFEFVYFSRPDSIIAGKYVYIVRGQMGALLAIEHPASKAEVVFSTPDAANPGAFGFAGAANLPITTYGLFRSHSVGRTFIEPVAEIRKKYQRIKFNPIPELVRGKRPVLVDDSIVRLNVLPSVIKLLMKAGMAAVDLRVHSPPLRFPCFLGIDIPTRQELARTNYPTDETIIAQIRKETGFQEDLTLGHLSLEGMIKATGLTGENFCTGCFTGNYPINPPSETTEYISCF